MKINITDMKIVEFNTILRALLIFIFLYPVNLYAEASIRVFQTQQPAQALIPSIAPLYTDQAKFTASKNSLIVKAPESVLNEIAQLLKDLDKPLQNLLIEVSSSLDDTDNFQYDGIEAHIKSGDNRLIRSRNPKSDNPNVSIRYGSNRFDSKGSVIKTTHTRRNSTRNNPEHFTLRTLEGHWAFIQTGQRVPYYTSGYPDNRGRRYYPPHQNSVDWVNVTSGFEVYPTLSGERVTLKVRPKNRSMNPQYSDRINTRSVDTMVSGRLDQWIYLGGIIKQINEQNSGTFYSTRRNADMDMNYRIKVKIIE